MQHGESEDNLTGKIGGDSDLTERGRAVRTLLYPFLATLTLTDMLMKVSSSSRLLLLMYSLNIT